MASHKMRDRFPLRSRRHHFFPSRSFSATLSSIVSARSRFSLEFHSSGKRSPRPFSDPPQTSRAFSRLAIVARSCHCRAIGPRDNGDGATLAALADLHVAKPGLPFVNGRIADAMLAAQIGTETPVSCSFRMPMICSSVNRDCFISGPFGWARAYLKLD